MSDFDPGRGFAGSAPGQDIDRVLDRLTIRDLQLIVGVRVLPLLPGEARTNRLALRSAARSCISHRARELLADPETRKTFFRNLDPGKGEELQHRFSMELGREVDPSEIAEAAFWPIAAGFFGLGVLEALRAPAPLQRQILGGRFSLFQHQRSVVRRAYALIGAGHGRTLVHMPTGSGKTRTAMHLVSQILNENEPCVVVWLASSRELLEQAAETFENAWSSLGNREVQVTRFWGSKVEPPADIDDGLLVAGLSKMHAWRTREHVEFLRLSARCRLVVIDEAHQAIAPTYRALMDDLCGAGQHHALLGLTATPGRSWNDVTADEELANYFQGSKVVLEAGADGNPVKFLLEQGYLARPSFHQIRYTPDIVPLPAELKRLTSADDFQDETLSKLAFDTARNLAILDAVAKLVHGGHQRIIVFAATVQHAMDLASALTARGVRSGAVSGETSLNEREALLRLFKSATNEPIVVCNFGVLTTGFDAPRTSAAVIARPTKSLVLFSQMVGRATRGVKAGGNATCEIWTVHDPAYPGFGDIAEAFFNWEDVWNDN